MGQLNFGVDILPTTDLEFSLGSSSKRWKINGIEISTLFSGTVGSHIKGMWLNSGVPTVMSGTVGTSYKGVYMSSGTITATSYETRATVNSGTANKLTYYSGANAISSYSSTIGSHTKGMWLNSGIPTAMSGTVGTAVKPIYMSSGTLTAGSYELKATVNSGATNKIAYYSGNNAISGYTSTIGSHTKGMWLNGGVPTAMSGTVGSATQPIYMSSGTITACSGTLAVNVTGTSSNVTGTVAIANGGTGATSAANARTNLGLGTAAQVASGTFSLSGHTHTTSIATSTGTNQLTLAFGTKYAITAGGTSYVFTTPSNPNTWRGIQDNLTSTSTTDSLSANQGRLLASGSARDNTKLPLAGGTMTGALHVSNTGTLIFDYTVGADAAMFVLKDATKYGIRYKEGTPDTLKISASGNADSDTGADFCINAHGDGTLATRNKRIPHTNNTTGAVGSATQPVYVNGGAITVCSGTLAVNISGNAATATKLGTSTVGGTAKPIYLNAGSPTAISATIGGVYQPVYLSSGTLSSCYGFVPRHSASNTSAAASGYHDVQGARQVSALQAHFNAGYTKSIAETVYLSTGNGEPAFGYTISGTSYNTVGTAYGGYFIPHYDVPRYVGIAGGVWKNHRLLMGPAAGYTGTSVPAAAAGTTNQLYFVRL